MVKEKLNASFFYGLLPLDIEGVELLAELYLFEMPLIADPTG